MEGLETLLKGILFIVITGVGVMVLKAILEYINARIDEVQKTTKLSEYAQLNKFIDLAQESITTAVTSVAQTYVDALKKSGSFSEEAQAIARTRATEIAKALISAESVNAIQIIHGDFDVYLANMIETICKQIKK